MTLTLAGLALGLLRCRKLIGGVAEWMKAPVSKIGEPQGSVGSNPTPSAILKVDYATAELSFHNWYWQLLKQPKYGDERDHILNTIWGSSARAWLAGWEAAIKSERKRLGVDW